MDSLGVHRPRNVDWKRAAALLYGDWGTSKAYVIGLAFVAAGYSSFPIILAVCALTGIVGYNYIIVCKHYPDGGGVYSAARDQSRLLAVIGALLLVAGFIVTASLSGWAAMSYFKVPREYVAISTVGVIFVVGMVNFFGPKHSGSFAVSLAAPTVIVVGFIIVFSLPHLTTRFLEPSHDTFGKNWMAFVGVILALSGVEAIANLTGVMKLDEGSSMDKPRIAGTARKSIWPVALEVVVGTSLLGWAMLSLPKSMEPQLRSRVEDMVSFLGEHYGTLALGGVFGKVFGIIVGIMVGLLLLSAVNTAVAAMIGMFYLLARDGEMPKVFGRLNPYGVPWLPLILSTLLPVLVVIFTPDLESLADLYAVGVVGAITVNLGACSFNKKLHMHMAERVVMMGTFLVLFGVELTIAKTKGNALFFALCVLGLGLSLRAYAQKRAGLRTLTVTEEIAAAISPEAISEFRQNLSPANTILVAARGLNPVLRFALEEARLRNASLYVLFVKEVAVTLPGPVESHDPPRWQDDEEASRIMYTMIALAKENAVPVVPLYALSDNPAGTILDLSATLGVDILMLGTSHRRTLVSLLKGNIVTEVAKSLPENIQVVIYG